MSEHASTSAAHPWGADNPRAPLPGHIRVRIDFAYDGTAFHGWAKQPEHRTVEAVMHRCLQTVLRASDLPSLVIAGRTDAGVHAVGAVAHCDIPQQVWSDSQSGTEGSPSATIEARLRGVLPGDITVRSMRPAPAGFDARFSAVGRRYRYRLCDIAANLDPTERARVVPVKRPLDIELLQHASMSILGLRDFAAVCKRREGATTIRTLTLFDWHRREDGIVEAVLQADAFCHSMVRALVGLLIPVGDGRYPPEWPAQVLQSRERHSAAVVMPARGLVLESVLYPADEELGQRAIESRAVRTLGVGPPV